MAVAGTRTLLSLDRFAKVLGLSPLHFNGVVVSGLDASVTCNTPMFQFAWQTAHRMSREDIATVIAQAEDMIADEAGYYPAPRWIQDERHYAIRPLRPELYNINSFNPRGQMISTQARYRYVMSGGQRATSVIVAGSTITYTDADSDSYDETATVTLDLTGLGITEACEIKIFYPGHNGDELWEIRDTTVAIVGNTATVQFRREQAVLEVLLEALNPRNAPGVLGDFGSGIEGTVDANFLTAVDSSRVFNDPQSMLRMEWEPKPSNCDCGDDCLGCGIGFQAGCMYTRGDPRDGLFVYRPATWNATTEVFDEVNFTVCRAPDHVRIWYRAGWEYQNGSCPNDQMDPKWELMVARLAASLLPMPICGCESQEFLINYWREDLNRVNDTGSHQLGFRQLNNPWGGSRGAQWVWNQLQRGANSVGQAVLT